MGYRGERGGCLIWRGDGGEGVLILMHNSLYYGIWKGGGDV